MKKYILSAIFLTLFNCFLYAEKSLDVKIMKECQDLKISCQTKFFLFIPSDKKKYVFDENSQITVSILNNKIKISKIITDSKDVEFYPSDNRYFIEVNSKPYRDKILIKIKEQKLLVINRIEIEKYLYGILCMETNPDWHIEALKAQAVISRTYALYNIEKHKSEGYNLCSEMHCQVYRGVNAENEKTNKAVDLTKGEILIYKNQIISAVYHSCCGGKTETASNVWKTSDKSLEYLKSLHCKYCRESPHYFWQNKINEEIICERLNKNGYDIKKINLIKLNGKTKSGRIKNILIKYKSITGKNDVIEMTSNEFRLKVDPWVIKSTYIISIKKKSGYYIFKGRGWGHGVGLCQWGTKYMAEKGASYKKILKYYYPGTYIEKIDY